MFTYKPIILALYKKINGINEMERFKMAVAVYLVLIKDGKILLQRRAGTNYYPGYYGIPCGHVEVGEGCLNALIREVKEETNLNIKEENITLLYTLNYFSDKEYINLFFTAKKYSGTPKIMEPHKCTELKFVELSNLPSNLVPEVRKYLADAKNGKVYGELSY